MAASKTGPNAESPRVAVVGSGPAGFYATELLIRQGFSVDLFERLPAPFGLLRYGVAPDHQNIKRAGVAFERTAQHECVRFFGNVDVGIDVSVQDLFGDYDQVLFAIGSATDRKLGVPGEDLEGSIAATSFVSWYNGHPDFSSHAFDLRSERAVIIGMGNVAMDVARILARRPHELANTDIASYALSALKTSRIREVVLLGRRGPAQAAFDSGELADIIALPGVDVIVDNEVSLVGVNELGTPARRNVELLATLQHAPRPEAERVVRLIFLAAPHALGGDGVRVESLEIERTELVLQPNGSVTARGTGRYETLPAGLVIRSVGYQGKPMPGLPFDNSASVIPNQAGRAGWPGELIPRCYVVGWIKRGAVGLLGSNKQDAKETVDRMLADRAAALANRAARKPGRVVSLLESRGHRLVSYSDWQAIDQKEREAGAQAGKIREKLTTIEHLLEAIDGR